MRRMVSLCLIVIFAMSALPAYPEPEYDPLHTMLALNMAIVSVHKIVTTEDRIVLQHEYDNIINKLALGNIESDYEMTGLYSELMNFITGKGLRQEEAARFRERYNRREQRQIIDALSGIRAYGGNLWSWLRSLATSCISSYFSYQTAKSELLEGFDEDMWKLKKGDIEECNRLQVMLLNASWNLLRQYKLPDEYRLTQESLNGYYKAVNEPEASKRLRMLRARNVERSFQVYPPYWYYRAKAAQESGNEEEALSCWDKFAEVWRPVLRNDPYKLEEAKYRVQRLAGNAEGNREEIRRLLGVIQDNTTAGDWSNNLFAGVAYFLLGDKDEGIACVEANVDFGYEEAVSKTILAEMKKGELDAFTLYALQRDIEAAIENPPAKPSAVKQPEPVKQTSGKRRDLTKEEIVAITTKYGFYEISELTDLEILYGIPGKIITYTWKGIKVNFFTYQAILFCPDKVCWSERTFIFEPILRSMRYDELRNDPKVTCEYLRNLFKDFPSEVVPMLMELKEFE